MLILLWIVIQKLEDLIQSSLQTLLGGKEIIEELQKIFSLPARLGGLGIAIPTIEAELEYTNSVEFTSQLAESTFNQDKN